MLSRQLMRSRFACLPLQNQFLNPNMMGANRLMYQPQRGIKLHEYQAGKLLDSYRVSIPIGDVAFTPEEAKKIAQGFDNGCVIKSQILGGGRGMGHIKETGFQGGVKLVDTPDQAEALAKEYIGNHLVTK